VSLVPDLRSRLGHALFLRVAGPDGDRHRSRIHDTPGPRWFADDRPIRQVHGDASMFIGGLRALMLQSLHPQTMAGFAAHSGYRADPWDRIARTSRFVAVTTYGTADDAQAAVDRVRVVHAHVRGTTPGGVAYDARDPRLMTWVHVAEVDSFLRAFQTYGAAPLDQDGRDAYVADTARVARALGIADPPATEDELADVLAGFRPELRGTPEARAAVRFVIWTPPLSVLARPGYGAVAAGAIGSLPAWARRELGLLPPVVSDAAITQALGAALGSAATATIRWALGPPERRRPAKVA
jgi:uncharacterized protein (DUF2236 family)